MDTPLAAPEETAYRLGSVSAKEHAQAKAWLGGGSRKWYWNPEAPAGGADKVIINLPEQKAFYYRGGNLAGVTVVSTGREGYSTPSGSYRVISKHQEHRSTLFGGYVDIETGRVVKSDVDSRKDPMPAGSKYVGAEMPYFLRLKHGPTGITSIGLHAGYLPGYPASHGCIRLPHAAAQKFFQEASIGTPVLLENSRPDTSSPPASATMLMAERSYGSGPGMPAYAPGSDKAKAAARAEKKRRVNANSQGVEVRENRRSSSGTSVPIMDTTRYYNP